MAFIEVNPAMWDGIVEMMCTPVGDNGISWGMLIMLLVALYVISKMSD